jgi:hypothetical protein
MTTDSERQAPTWDQINAAIQELAWQRGEWAGYPTLVDGVRLHMEERWPDAPRWEAFYMPVPGEETTRVCGDDAVREDVHLRNRWFSEPLGLYVSLWQVGRQIELTLSSASLGARADMLLQTIGAARAWDMNAEIKAMSKLGDLVTEWAWRCYFLTGTFLETSPRSGVTYVFRRLRPTLAMKHTGKAFEILAALCLHPIGYYVGSYAGAMVPTDDVIAHLLLMRGDEHKFWRQANQHEPRRPEAGL